MKRVLILCLVTAVLAPAALAGQFLQHKGSTPGSFIVRLQDDLPGSADDLARDLGRAHGLDVTHVYSAIFNGFAFRGGEAAARALARNPHVRYVEEAFRADVMGTQSPAPSWGLDRIDQRLLSLDNSYTYPETGSGSTIYIVDTGVNAVSDLSGRIASHTNYVSTENRTDDCFDHGTSVASIAAGTTYGVAKGATIVNVRAFGCNGGGAASDILAALNDITNGYVSGQKKIANLSWRADPASQSLDDAVSSMVSTGIVVATAAGYYVDACNISPARLGASVSGIVTVSSSQSNDSFDGSAGVGACVDILAPTYVTTVNAAGQQTTFSGTSASVPHVSGALALLQQRHSLTNPAQLEATLKQNASPGVVIALAANTPNLLLHTLPSVGVTPGTSLMYASETTTASVTPVSGATYTWTIFNGTLTGGQGTTTATFRAGCSTVNSQHVAAKVSVTTASGTTTGMTAVSLLKPKATVSGTHTIQAGQSATLSANLFGKSPWTFIWSDDYQQTASTSPATHAVSPPSSEYFRVVYVVDAYGCIGTTSGFATVNVQ